MRRALTALRGPLTAAALLLAGTADAVEVVWLGPHGPDQAAWVAEQAGAQRAPLTPLDLRVAATAWSADDDAAYAALESALKEVRAFETRLDGELVIMRDLQRPIAAIGVVRDVRDRTRLHAALAYQGFAVDRYFEDTLATAPEAEPYRAWLGEQWVAKPWLDAVALAPDKDVTPYEIAEAPQRVAYNTVRDVARAALPGTLVPFDLPQGSRLIVDGSPAEPGSTGDVKVPPGRHLVHAELDGQIVARWDLRVGAGDEVALQFTLTDTVWRRFLRDVAERADVPEPLRPAIEALGGEVWLARVVQGQLEVLSMTPESIRRVELQQPTAPERSGGGGGGGLSVTAGVLTGWLGSHDFYLQDPANAPRTVGTVNSATLGLSLGADLDVGPLRLGAGVDAHLTPGAHHTANYGEASTRVRPHPHLAVGLRPVQATVGFLAPWHPTLGLRVTAPLVGPLELRGSAFAGLPRTLDRADLTTYTTGDLFAASAGVGLRL